MAEMTQVEGAPRAQGLLSRIVGIVLSPRETFQAVVSKPKWLGAMAVVVTILAVATAGITLTETGRLATLDAQVSQMEAFGVNVTDEMYAEMQHRIGSPMSIATTAIAIAIFSPLVTALIGLLLFLVFNVAMGGSATFKQLYAVLAHAGVIGALQQVFAFPLNLLRGSISNPASLSVFVPMLDESSFLVRFLGMVDLFYVWQTVVTAIGLAVLYRRRTQPIVLSLLAVYLVIAVCIAAVMSAMGGS
jgi:hypothetical protein